MNFLDSCLPDRFWSKCIPEPNSGCWLWLAATSGGYGKIRNLVGRKVYAHRFAYEQIVGPVASDLDLDHLCRQKACVNPAHLDAVTHRENVLRGSAPAARQAAQLTCKRGHALTAANIYRDNSRNGTRRKCKPCDQLRERKYQ